MRKIAPEFERRKISKNYLPKTRIYWPKNATLKKPNDERSQISVSISRNYRKIMYRKQIFNDEWNYIIIHIIHLFIYIINRRILRIVVLRWHLFSENCFGGGLRCLKYTENLRVATVIFIIHSGRRNYS